jgi:hypothetical protein
MKNGDMPAAPVKPEFIGSSPKVYTGLTKREHFAAMFMQTMLIDDSTHDSTYEQIAYLSIDIADALLEELDKRK